MQAGLQDCLHSGHSHGFEWCSVANVWRCEDQVRQLSFVAYWASERSLAKPEGQQEGLEADPEHLVEVATEAALVQAAEVCDTVENMVVAFVAAIAVSELLAQA